MASSTPTPISPPTNTTSEPTTSTPSTTANEPPISPIAKQTTFPHKTSAAVSTRTPFIDTTTPPINDAPVELDGAPAPAGRDTEPGTGETGARNTATRKGSVVVSPGLGSEDEIAAEFLGDGKARGREWSEARAAMLAKRGKDPGVIVDLPTEPTAEEVLAARATEGATTPGLR